MVLTATRGNKVLCVCVRVCQCVSAHTSSNLTLHSTCFSLPKWPGKIRFLIDIYICIYRVCIPHLSPNRCKMMKMLESKNETFPFMCPHWLFLEKLIEYLWLQATEHVKPNWLNWNMSKRSFFLSCNPLFQLLL